MHPVNDHDALILLATTLSSKRRPAELLDIVAAADLLQGSVPGATKVLDSLVRLSTHGLIRTSAGGLELTPPAQELMAAIPAKGDHAERIFLVRTELSGFPTQADQPPADVALEALNAAIAEHQAAKAAAAKSKAKNLLVPKPKPEESNKKGPGFRQRKPLPRRRKG